MTDEEFNRMMTEGILGAAEGVPLGDVELVAAPGGAMAPAVLTDEERAALSEALGF